MITHTRVGPKSSWTHHIVKGMFSQVKELAFTSAVKAKQATA
jgi:hypothetical protein